MFARSRLFALSDVPLPGLRSVLAEPCFPCLPGLMLLPGALLGSFLLSVEDGQPQRLGHRVVVQLLLPL
jgi:hypothetical protein